MMSQSLQMPTSYKAVSPHSHRSPLKSAVLRVCLSGFEGDEREKLITIITKLKGKHESNLQHGVDAVVSS